MIMYSIIPQEAFDESYYTVPQTSRFFKYEYGFLEGVPHNDNTFEVVNIVSTDPQAYLDKNKPLGKKIIFK